VDFERMGDLIAAMDATAPRGAGVPQPESQGCIVDQFGAGR